MAVGEPDYWKEEKQFACALLYLLGPSCDLQSGSSILGFSILNPENLKMCNF